MAAKSVALLCLMNKIKMKMTQNMNPDQLIQIQDFMSPWQNLEHDVMRMNHAAIRLGVSLEMMASVNNTFIKDLLIVWQQ